MSDLFRKRSRDNSQLGNEEDDIPSGTADPKNDRLSIDGLPGPSFALSQHTNVDSGTVNPQGSLLPAHSVTNVMSDVETAPAGGVAG